MYIKDIYDEWKLHHDATQIEINYNFLVKFINILNTESLQQTNGVITNDANIIRKWKILKIDRILKQFNKIATYDFNNFAWINHPKIFVKSIFIVGDILNSLKITNYKSSEINSFYEPKLFIFAEKYLDIQTHEEWITMLSTRIFAQSNTGNETIRKYNWSIDCNNKNLKNHVWHVENLLINFKEIATWFNNIKDKSKSFNENKDSIINIMNHRIIYALTDFYAKYYTELNSQKYLDVYSNILNEILIDVKNRTFAIVSFQQIASFLNYLLNSKIILENDSFIINFLSFIQICCSEKNIEKLKLILFNTNPDIKSYVKIVYENKKTHEFAIKPEDETDNFINVIKPKNTNEFVTKSEPINRYDNLIKKTNANVLIKELKQSNLFEQKPHNLNDFTRPIEFFDESLIDTNQINDTLVDNSHEDDDYE